MAQNKHYSNKEQKICWRNVNDMVPTSQLHSSLCGLNICCYSCLSHLVVSVSSFLI